MLTYRDEGSRGGRESSCAPAQAHGCCCCCCCRYERATRGTASFEGHNREQTPGTPHLSEGVEGPREEEKKPPPSTDSFYFTVAKFSDLPVGWSLVIARVFCPGAKLKQEDHATAP
jgi:hypothetical protein